MKECGGDGGGEEKAVFACRKPFPAPSPLHYTPPGSTSPSVLVLVVVSASRKKEGRRRRSIMNSKTRGCVSQKERKEGWLAGVTKKYRWANNNNSSSKGFCRRRRHRSRWEPKKKKMERVVPRPSFSW